jgi:hypothetical protein
MFEILPWAGGASAGLAVASALSIGTLRRAGVVGPLIEAETRRSIWLRAVTLVVWLLVVAIGCWYLSEFLSSVHVWVGYSVGGLTALALAALGIGVALL